MKWHDTTINICFTTRLIWAEFLSYRAIDLLNLLLRTVDCLVAVWLRAYIRDWQSNVLSTNSLADTLYLSSVINFGIGKLTELKRNNWVTERLRTCFVVGQSAWLADLCPIRGWGQTCLPDKKIGKSSDWIAGSLRGKLVESVELILI